MLLVIRTLFQLCIKCVNDSANKQNSNTGFMRFLGVLQASRGRILCWHVLGDANAIT